jgi:hypothetical protein
VPVRGADASEAAVRVAAVERPDRSDHTDTLAASLARAVQRRGTGAAPPPAGSRLLQRMPVLQAGAWRDPAVATAAPAARLVDLAPVVAYHYAAQGGAQLRDFLRVLKENLTATELKGLLAHGLDVPVQNLAATINIFNVRLPGTDDPAPLIADANKILGAYGFTINVVGTQRLKPAGLAALDAKGSYRSSSSAAADLALMQAAAPPQGVDALRVFWVDDILGHGWFSTPNAKQISLQHTVHGAPQVDDHGRPVPTDDAVIMRRSQTGQTLAHELGHALGGLHGGLGHGAHVNDWDEWNLMHGDPIIHALHTSLRPEQVAAWKGSRYVT